MKSSKTRNKSNRFKHIKKIQSYTDIIINCLKKEDPNLNIDFVYTNKKIKSRYICVLLDHDKQFIIRISDHDNNRKDTYNYNIIIDIDNELNTCSIVLDILDQIKIYKEKGDKNANTSNNK